MALLDEVEAMSIQPRQKYLQNRSVRNLTGEWMEASEQYKVGGLTAAVNDDTAEGEAS